MVQYAPSFPYHSLSYWLETCGDNLQPRPPLDSSITVDVAILGGGFTGLWTAYYLISKNPTLKIAILERRISGFGASGRNGGWCTPEFSISPAVAIKRFGLDQAKTLHESMNDTVKEAGTAQTSTFGSRDYKGLSTTTIPRSSIQVNLFGSLAAFSKIWALSSMKRQKSST